MTRDEVLGLQLGSKVIPTIGPRIGWVARVLKKELDSGAYTGWLTLRFHDGETGLFAGEEIQRAPWVDEGECC